MADTVSVLHSTPGSGLISWLAKAYQTTSDLLYFTTYRSMPPSSISPLYNLAIYDLFQNHVPSAKQLLPTFNFLVPNGPLSCESNGWLDNLNTDNSIHRMGKENDTTGKVRTKVFAGTNTYTLNNIAVGFRWCGNPLLYKDGQPLSSWLTGETLNGDGTVLTKSASLGGKVDYTETTGTHMSLIKTYVNSKNNELVKYVTGSAPNSSLKIGALNKTMSTLSVNNNDEISIGVNGRAQLYIEDPQGKKSGIDPATDLRADEIANASILIDAESGNISISDAIDGTYTVYLKGTRDEDYLININYMDDSDTETFSYAGFNHANVSSFTFVVDSGSINKMTVNLIPLPPAGLQADAVGAGTLTTRLSWIANTDPGVDHYNIYSKYDDEPYLAQIGTSTVNVYDTGHPWASDSSIKTRIYAVSAVKADGTESFLSNMVENNDRDHDGLTDDEETISGTDPDNPDSDGDGLTDGEEYVKGTNPLLADTDGDGYSDYEEIWAGTDPLDADSYICKTKGYCPDLKVVSVAFTPAKVVRGGDIDVTDITKNRGKAPAIASTTRYYLSKDNFKSKKDILLSDSSVQTLNASASSPRTTTVTIPADTRPGSYYIIACADDMKQVTESKEKNNCRASKRIIKVKK